MSTQYKGRDETCPVSTGKGGGGGVRETVPPRRGAVKSSRTLAPRACTGCGAGGCVRRVGLAARW